MSETVKHTLGPWSIREGHRHSPEECDLTICGDVFQLADINGPNYAHCEANARLISGAPDMLAALKDFVSETRAYSSPECEECPIVGPLLRAADAAIAKAEGRS